MLKCLGVDLIRVKMSVPKKGTGHFLPEGHAEDEWGVIYRRVSQSGGGSYYEIAKSPLADATLNDLKNYPWPDPNQPGVGEAVAGAQVLHRMHHQLPARAVGPPLGGVFTATQGLDTTWNSPLDERGIIGAAMGLGLAGTRCVATSSSYVPDSTHAASTPCGLRT